MRNILAEIQALEIRLATDYKEYKQEHPGTQKSPGDPMFKPQLGQTKPHLQHEEMAKLPPHEHRRLLGEHLNLVDEARRKGNEDVAAKHQEAAVMHDSFSKSNEKLHKNYAKHLHQKLSS